MPDKIISIVGPTGIGKSQLGIKLALQYHGEIINADSRQIFRYLDIGTAKPVKSELEMVSHHLIDIINPDQDFSLAEYQKLVYAVIPDILQRKKIPLLVGGSGQYIRAVLEGWVIPEVAPDHGFRAELEQRVASGMADDLYAELKNVDPEAAQKIDPRNIRRVIRALEVNKNGIGKFSQLQKKNPPPVDCLTIGLTAPRAVLYRKVDERVDQMIARGLVAEVQGLLRKGYDINLPSMSGIGYREIGAYLKGDLTLGEAIDKIKTGTHRYIRQQYTWFRLQDQNITWFDITEDVSREIDRVVKKWLMI